MMTKYFSTVCSIILLASIVQDGYAQTTLFPVIPKENRGNFNYERTGSHDANNIRTLFKNYGMVGSYPDEEGYKDVTKVDLSAFHSVEVPKGTGMNYTDGITPFVLAKIKKTSGDVAWIMETGYREREQRIIGTERYMRFEPRPGYFQLDLSINKDRSPAMSHLPRTWPDAWIDKLDDPTDPGWKNDGLGPGGTDSDPTHAAWNGYFKKRIAADQESFTVMDDDEYKIPSFNSDSRDLTRGGLGLRIEVRGFQWSNPQAGNVIFWHYDIANESTTDYLDNIIFGLYMDSGVGGSSIGCDGVAESDDDNAKFDTTSGLNLVYTWDYYGHGKSLIGNCGTTGYLGYAYLETPGKPDDGIDNDHDGITDEKRDGNIGQKIVGQQNILEYVNSHYNRALFEAIYGSVTSRPAYKDSVWFTGDEDMDWSARYNDTGADGVFGTHDAGENDGIPTQGETNFGETDLHESDQIGLTGFKINRIAAGASHPSAPIDGITFWNDPGSIVPGQSGIYWPEALYAQFTGVNGQNPFDAAQWIDYNIGFLFASGTFKLPAGSRERFSLALAYGTDLYDLRKTTAIVQQIYNANYQFATPPPRPTLTGETGDHYVKLSWDDAAERGIDPITYVNDFEGYRIYRSTDPAFRDVKVISNAQGTGEMIFGKPLVQFDLIDQKQGYSNLAVDGVEYFLGSETGIRHEYKDTTVNNGQIYYYAIVAYDYGNDSLKFYPSENAVSVSQTVRGGIILPPNVVEVRPEPKVSGFVAATTSNIRHTKGHGVGSVSIEIANSNLVPDNRTVLLHFKNGNALQIRPDLYELVDSVSGKIYLEKGTDLSGLGTGEVGFGMKPSINTPVATEIDTANTGYQKGNTINVKTSVLLEGTVDITKRNMSFPKNIRIIFSNTVVDTSIGLGPQARSTRTKFSVFADNGDGSRTKLPFALKDLDKDSTLGGFSDALFILDTAGKALNPIWTLSIDTLGKASGLVPLKPTTGDTFSVRLKIPITSSDEYSFSTSGQRIDANKAKNDFTMDPYVVPNPYVGAASFEPAKYAISGRGERRMEFRGIPANAVVRIYTISGALVQTLYHDGSNDGFVPWNLRTKDNMDVAPGLYIFHVDGNQAGTHIGKFAVIK